MNDLAEELLTKNSYLLKATSNGGGGETGNTSGIVKTVSADVYNQMTSSERADYRSTLNEEQRTQLLNF